MVAPRIPKTRAEPFTLKTDLFWTDRASCRDFDPEIFFVEVPSGRRPSDGSRDDPWAEARSICMKCPVRRQCREEYWELPGDNLYGMYFGMTPEERVIYRRNRRKGKYGVA